MDGVDLLMKVNLSFTVVVCYGIGRVGSCPIAQQQLALLLLILEELKPSQSWLYDPVLVEEEREAVQQCGCTLFTTNDVCIYINKFDLHEALLTTPYNVIHTDVQVYCQATNPLLHASLWPSHVQQSALGKLGPQDTVTHCYHWELFQ